MWMLTFIPDSILLYFVNIILWSGIIASIVGFVFKFAPLMPYRLMIQIVGVLLLAAGLYFKGGFEVETQWRERVAEMQAKVDAAEEKSKVVNTVVKTKVVTKFKTIHDTKIITQEVIKEVAAKIDTECKVAPEALIILNSAAHNKVPLNLTIPKEELK